MGKQVYLWILWESMMDNPKNLFLEPVFGFEPYELYIVSYAMKLDQNFWFAAKEKTIISHNFFILLIHLF